MRLQSLWYSVVLRTQYLHLLAMAHAIEIDLTMEDFDRIQKKTPHLADLRPSGKYVMEDLHRIGGVQAVMKMLLEAGYLHGDCLTVTGKTIAENLKDAPDLAEGQKIIMPFDKAFSEDGPLVILKGNLSTKWSCFKNVRRICNNAYWTCTCV